MAVQRASHCVLLSTRGLSRRRDGTSLAGTVVGILLMYHSEAFTVWAESGRYVTANYVSAIGVFEAYVCSALTAKELFLYVEVYPISRGVTVSTRSAWDWNTRPLRREYYRLFFRVGKRLNVLWSGSIAQCSCARSRCFLLWHLARHPSNM